MNLYFFFFKEKDTMQFVLPYLKVLIVIPRGLYKLSHLYLARHYNHLLTPKRSDWTTQTTSLGWLTTPSKAKIGGQPLLKGVAGHLEGYSYSAHPFT
jgi:hypothetical protein